jgi:arginyl-tRNA synthetase
MNLLSEVRSLFEPALMALAPDVAALAKCLATIGPTRDAKHGDYEAKFAPQLAAALKKPNSEAMPLAKQVLEMIGTDPMVESFATAGPGFVNLRLKDSWIAEQVRTIAADERLGVATAATPKTFVIDYSAPNVAKPLHVGHLRSTIIGDSLLRILRFLGHTVIGDNHLGDWGTQFGILIHGYKNFLDKDAYAKDPVRELARLYVHVRNLAKMADDDDEAATGSVMDACRAETAKLHAGDPENVALWKQFMPHCMEEIHSVYTRLKLLPFDNILGESFYQPQLSAVVADLLAKGIAVESQGALVVPNAKGVIPTAEELGTEEPPQLVRKRDGAFTYMTTDLATIKYRVETWKPDVLLELHCRTLFANARRWGYDGVEFQHLKFGSVLGPDGKPISTRAGGGTELHDLISRAVAMGLEKYKESHADRKAHGHDVPDLTPEFEREIAETVGVGAMKYADLGQNRVSDYTFSFEKMLATTGNTATYMQYAYARCRSIFRKGNADEAAFRTDPPAVLITFPAERALALQLLKFGDVLAEVATKYEPHHIAAYLFDLGQAFSAFYEAGSKDESKKVVNDTNPPEVQASRLLLTDLTARTIRTGLDLLGIRVVERM